MKTFTPSGNRVLVCPDEAETKTPGGIVIPDQAKEKPRRGKIVAKGIGKRRENGEGFEAIPFDEGDTVVYDRYQGHAIMIGKDEFLVLDVDWILGTMTN